MPKIGSLGNIGNNRSFWHRVCYAGPRGGGITTSKIKNLLCSAEAAFSRNEKQTAIVLLRQAVALNPTDYFDLNRLAGLKSALCPHATDLVVPDVPTRPRFEPTFPALQRSAPPPKFHETIISDRQPAAKENPPAIQTVTTEVGIEARQVPAPPIPAKIKKPAPVQISSLSQEQLTQKERLTTIFARLKENYHQKDHSGLVRVYDESATLLGDNVLALSYCLFAKLVIKYPLLLKFSKHYYGSRKDNAIKSALLFLGRLERMIRALDYLKDNLDKSNKELAAGDPIAYNLINNANRVIYISEARAIVKFPPDTGTETRVAQELRAEFDKAIALEIHIESAGDKRARLAKERERAFNGEREELRRRVIQHFIDNPDAKSPFPGWLWHALYREGYRVLNGAKEAKRLAQAKQDDHDSH